MSTRRGRQLRAEVLAESDICWRCGHPGADTAGHVIPWTVRPDLAYTRSNIKPEHGRRRPEYGCPGNYASGNRAPDATPALRTSQPW